MSGFYDFVRFKIPSRFLKWLSRYHFESEELQSLVQQQPKPIYVISIDLSTARSSADPLVLDVPGRGFVAYGYDPSTSIKTRVTTSLVNVRINDNRPEYEFPAKYNRGYHGDFTKLYLNWPAQDGVSVDFVIHQFNDMPWETDSLDADQIQIGELVVGGTAGSVLFVGAGGVLAQDNSNFFWDDTNNRLGIGTNTPVVPLHVVGTGNTSFFDAYSNSAPVSPAFFSRRSRGTVSVPLGVVADDTLTGLFGSGMTSALSFAGNSVAVKGWAAETYTITNQGSYLTLETTPIGSTTRSERVRVNDTGLVGINTSTPSSFLHVAGSIAGSYTSTNVDLTLDNTHWMVAVDASVANRTITLPAANTCLGRIYNIKKTDASANTVTITRAGADTIDGATTLVLTLQYQSRTIISDGASSWWII